METRQAPHQKLEEQEIKDLICSLVTESYELRIKFNEIELKLNSLKRHFCPEKFQEVKVPMAALSDLMREGYSGLNLSQPSRMTRPEETNANPT